MKLMSYLDFDMSVHPSEQGYVARVLNSPAGQAEVHFEMPFSELELDNFLLRIGRPRRTVRRINSPEMEAARTFGGRLFDTAFDKEIGTCLWSSLDEAERQQAGLRIRLRLTQTPELADLPWEYLYSTTRNRFLSLSVETPLVSTTGGNVPRSPVWNVPCSPTRKYSG